MTELIQNGLMTAAGQRMIEAAKRDGSRRSLDAAVELRVPADLAALAADLAEADFNALTMSDRKRLVWWIDTAKPLGTRSTRGGTLRRPGRSRR